MQRTEVGILVLFVIGQVEKIIGGHTVKLGKRCKVDSGMPVAPVNSASVISFPTRKSLSRSPSVIFVFATGSPPEKASLKRIIFMIIQGDTNPKSFVLAVLKALAHTFLHILFG